MKSKAIKIQVPGSTANLGPGFDALALALGIYTRLTFEFIACEETPALTPGFFSGRCGRGSSPCRTPCKHPALKDGVSLGPDDQNNLIYKVLCSVWQDKLQLLNKVHITIESDIPLARGLGSSAAVILGTIWAAAYLQEQILDQGTLLANATTFEGHADNLAASLLGGLVVCAPCPDKQTIVTQKIPWPDDWHTLVIVPQYCLSTHKARSVLPKKVSLADAVSNVQRTALLVAAVCNRDEEALQEALHDKLHEPYRLKLVPELAQIRSILTGLPYLGCTLSGAGSSVLVIVSKKHKAPLLQCLKEWAASQVRPPQVLDLKVDSQGLQELEDG